MKTLVMTLLIACIVVIASAIAYLDWQKGRAIQTHATQATATPTAPTPSTVVPQPTPAVAKAASGPAPVAISAPALETASNDSVSPIKKLADALLTAKSGKEKQALFDELRKDPQQLEAVISQLKQDAQENPSNPEIPTTIGEADLNEIRAMKESGDNSDIDQIGIMAMQADQEFNAALQIDPKNWEAQFVKDSSMYYWPANPQTDNQAVQGLTGLIDQQETMPQNPDFAQTYVMLGNEYQKIGQPDKALATWQLGAQEYPGNSALQQKIAGASAQ
jgi:tetratricopeptide (TPR) repeat protein